MMALMMATMAVPACAAVLRGHPSAPTPPMLRSGRRWVLTEAAAAEEAVEAVAEEEAAAEWASAALAA